MSARVLSTLTAGWSVLVLLVGIGHFALGAAILYDGPGALLGPVFEQTNRVPWWLWGSWAVVAGALVITRRTTLAGLALTAGWYVTWAALLIIGIVAADGPRYVIPVYLLLAAIHFLVAFIHFIARPVTRA